MRENNDDTIGRPDPDGSDISRRQFMYGTAAAAAAGALLTHGSLLPLDSASRAPAGLRAAPSAPAGPYLVGDVAVAKGVSTTATVTVTTTTNAGDAIVVCPATTGGDTVVNGVTDSKGNTYTLTKSATNGALGGWAYVSLNSKQLSSTSQPPDWIKVTYSGTAAHNVKAVGVPGATAVDTSAAAAGNSATPTVTTGTLAQATETLVAMETNDNTGGAIAWSSTGFTPLRIDGGGTITMAALSGGVLAAGGDVEGYFLSSDQGDHWTVTNTGVWGQYWRDCACIAWSQLEPNTVYSCCGDGSANGGGFLVSGDGGNTWQMRSKTTPIPQFNGNHESKPLPTGGAPRSTGYLLAQDSTAPGYLYAASYDGGVFRSTDKGKTWTNIGLGPDSHGNKYYARSLALDPVTGNLWVAMYDYDGNGTFGHVWECTSPRTAMGTPNWSPLPNSPAIVEELKVIGNCLYAAAGGAGMPGLTGIYRHQIGTTTWTSLNGLDGTQSIDTATSYWRTLDGYVSGSSHIVIWSCDNPVIVTNIKPPDATYRCLVETVVDSSGKVTSASFLTNTGNVQLQYIPPDHRLWWHHNGPFQDWLGGSAYVNGHITIDPNHTLNIYVTADNGFYRSIDGGKTWTIASNGMPLFVGRSVAVVPDPSNPGHIVLGDSDWCSWDITDGIAEDGNTTHTTPVPVPSLEGYALAADPTDGTVFISAGQKYTNAQGDVWSRPFGTLTWNTPSTGLGALVGSQVAIGLAVTRDTTGNQYVLAAVEKDPSNPKASKAGMWRMVNGGAWAQVDTVIGTAAQTTEYMAIAALPGSQYVYALDRGAGVLFRANNYGSNNNTNAPWDNIWTFSGAVNDPRTGFLALNPAVANELWVSNLQGLYKISNANSGTANPVSISGVTFPGAIAFTADGTVYCINVASSGTNADTQLLRSVDGGSTWQDVSGPGPGVAANASRPTNMAIGPDRRIYIANEGNIVAQGFPAAGWTAQGGGLHTSPNEYTGAATQVVGSTAPITATGATTGGNWLMVVVALKT